MVNPRTTADSGILDTSAQRVTSATFSKVALALTTIGLVISATIAVIACTGVIQITQRTVFLLALAKFGVVPFSELAFLVACVSLYRKRSRVSILAFVFGLVTIALSFGSSSLMNILRFA